VSFVYGFLAGTVFGVFAMMLVIWVFEHLDWNRR